jgi:CPA2 family monovalent cation:H+ antiporter-2
VIHPELEGGLEIVRHTLLALEFPLVQVEQYIEAVRHDGYDTAISSHTEHRMLEQLLTAMRGLTVGWHRVSADSPLVARSLAAANMRAESGASVITVVRNHEIIPNPKSSFVFAAGDMVGVVGDTEQVRVAGDLIAAPGHPGNAPHSTAASPLPASPEGSNIAGELGR